MAKTTMEAPPLERKLVAILAADVVGYSRLMHDNEERTLATLTAHRAIIDELIANGRGEIAGTAGDSVLAEFASVVDAVRCAVSIQQALAKANEPLPAESRMLFRIGINVGDVMVKDGDIFGDGVNVAARLEGIAEPGGICVTRGVRDHLRDRMEYKFEDLGEHSVKNIARPVRVFRVWFDPNGTTELAASEPPPPSAEALSASGSGDRPRKASNRSSWHSGNPSRPATIRRSIRPISSNFRKARSLRWPKRGWPVFQFIAIRPITPSNSSSGIPSRTLRSGQILKRTSKSIRTGSSGAWPRSGWQIFPGHP